MTRAHYRNHPDVHVALIVHKVVRVGADCPRSVVRPIERLTFAAILILVPIWFAHLAASRSLSHCISSLDSTTSSLGKRDINQLSKVLFSV
jgi:hypothetical protein